MKARSSRRDFIRRTLFGAAITGLVSAFGAPADSTSGDAQSQRVDRRRLGRIGAEVSILGLGLGGAFMDGYEGKLDAGHALLESALAQGINYWDTARSYGPSEGMIAPVLVRNRNNVFLASKSDARDYDGFKRDLERSLQVLRTDHIDLYQLHDLRPREWADLGDIESGAVRAARKAKDQKVIRSFGVTGHSGAGILIECMKRFDPDVVLTIFPSTRPDKGRYEDELLPLARARKIGVIGMKTIRFAREAGLPAKELLRYALSLDGVNTVIVGLDSLRHLNENATVASNFGPMKEGRRDELSKSANAALAGVLAPWDRAGYLDCPGFNRATAT
jgi:aryl-alcohol dehydrogenase-like predicted oxidoreductase